MCLIIHLEQRHQMLLNIQIFYIFFLDLNWLAGGTTMLSQDLFAKTLPLLDIIRLFDGIIVFIHIELVI